MNILNEIYCFDVENLQWGEIRRHGSKISRRYGHAMSLGLK